MSEFLYFFSLVLLFWAAVHLINAFRPRSSLRRASPTSTFSLSYFSLQFSTTKFNSLPAYFLSIGRRKRRNLSAKDGDDPLRTRRATYGFVRIFYDVGAVVAVLGIVGAQAVLAWATLSSIKGVYTLWRESRGGEHGSIVRRRIIKRALSTLADAPDRRPDAQSAASSLLLRPVLPGITTPLAALPIILFALLSAQTFHEIGHALAASAESIPLLTTGIHLYLLLPTFYVSLAASSSPTSQITAVSDLRIASAGIWHSIVLVGVAWGMSEQGFGVGGFLGNWLGTPVGGGVVVVDVDSNSPLFAHLRPYSLITHLNDLELDSDTSPFDLWSSYLHDGFAAPISRWKKTSSTTNGQYDDMGWCLPIADLDVRNADRGCCSDSTDPIATSSISKQRGNEDHLLCFSIAPNDTSSVKSKSCLDPISFFPPSEKIPPRCLASSNCGDGLGCARADAGEMVLRISVRDDQGLGDREERTIIWQGPRKGVWEQVSVSNVVPRFWWVPLSLARNIEQFYSHLQSLSLAIAFFNLLPLPHLDGSAILISFFSSITSSSSSSLIIDDALRTPFSPPKATGLLVGFLSFFERPETGRERDKRWIVALRRSTTVMGVVLVICTALVETLNGRTKGVGKV